MRLTLFLILVTAYLLPVGVFANGIKPVNSTHSYVRPTVSTISSRGNSYVLSPSIILTTPVKGDFLAGGGSVITTSPIFGDDLIMAGSINSRSSVSGDFRALGGSIDISKPIAGDLIAVGLSVRDSGQAGGNVYIVAVNATLSNGARGQVTIYGNNVALAGNFSGNVKVFAGGRITISPNTKILGRLSYEAPEIANIPKSVKIIGGVSYKNASYLPDAGTSRVLAFISVGFFLIIRIVGALILAGLLAGLFPKFAQAVVGRIFEEKFRDILLLTLLGFAIIVAMPIVIILLMLTFVGLGIAFLVGTLYLLLLLLSLMYAGILVGGIIARHFMHREQIIWHDGVIGMTVFSLLYLIPFVGLPLAIILILFSAGTLLQIFFRFAFPRGEYLSEEI